jgi:hypothetical protein
VTGKQPPARKAAPAGKTAVDAPPLPPVTVADWGLVALLTALAIGSGAFEVLLVPLYAGSWLVPISVLLGVVGNIVLPRSGFALVRVPSGALAPVLGWLVAVLVPIIIARPEGDIHVAGGGGQQWVLYALLVFGGLAGFTTFVRSSAAAPSTARTSSGAVRVR